MKAEPRGQHPTVYEFGSVRVDVGRRTISRDGAAVSLYPRSFDALVLLLEHRGQLLDKDFLMRKLWPHTAVEENSLARAVSDIRRALGEGPKDQRYVATVPRVGYQFVAEVRAIHGAAEQERDRPTGTAEGRPPIRSLAVLPLACVNPAAGDEYLALGLADSLITRLSKIRRLVVRPTSAVVRIAADTPPAAAGRELHVDAVVSGTIRRLGSRVRVTVQLVSVGDESSLWAEQLDAESDDLFAIEDSISERVAGTLVAELTRPERTTLAQRHTGDREAYRLFLKGRYFWSKRTEASLQTAIRFLEQALQKDPKLALAHAAISDCYIALGLQSAIPGGLAPNVTLPRAREAALRAIALDDSLAEAHASLGHVKVCHDWDWTAGERSFHRSIELNPNYASAHHWYAMALGMVARHDDALAEIRRALELDPHSLMINGNFGYLLYRARRYDEAVAAGEEAVELDPSFAVNRYRLGLAYQAKGLHEAAEAEFAAMSPTAADPLGWTALAHLYAVTGRVRDAEEMLETLLAVRQQRYVAAVFFAEIFAGLGRAAEALDWLERGVEERPIILLGLKVNPKFDILRGEPRFADIIRRIGLWS